MTSGKAQLLCGPPSSKKKEALASWLVLRALWLVLRALVLGVEALGKVYQLLGKIPAA